MSTKPGEAQSFEPIGISSAESTGVVELLHSIAAPSPRIQRAILGALEWVREVQLSDGRWARYYEIGTDRPIFSGRDGVIRYDVSEIEEERQMNYAWFGTWPKRLLTHPYGDNYIDSLYEAVEDYPALRLVFRGLRDHDKVSGVIPVDIMVLHPSRAEGIEYVVVALDDQVIYEGTNVPDNGHLTFDTEQLEDGKHILSATATHRDLGRHKRAITIQVNNVWSLTQDMRPPSESWFGTLDYLQTSTRSQGWGYDVEHEALFFGDPHLLVRTTDSEEYLIWDTPRLTSVTMVAYVQGDTILETGLRLAVAREADEWRDIPYPVEYEEGGGEWRRVTIEVELEESTSGDRFRLILTSNLSKETLQIGRIVLSGYRKP